MKISIDNLVAVVQPDQVNWEPPMVLAHDGDRAPIYAPYWRLRLALSRVTEVLHQEWFALMDGATHTLNLPHPATGVMTAFTGYVETVTGSFDVRRDCKAAMTGVDIIASGISVTV